MRLGSAKLFTELLTQDIYDTVLVAYPRQREVRYGIWRACQAEGAVIATNLSGGSLRGCQVDGERIAEGARMLLALPGFLGDFIDGILLQPTTMSSIVKATSPLNGLCSLASHP